MPMAYIRSPGVPRTTKTHEVGKQIMNRVVVCGAPCAGKSTYAREVLLPRAPAGTMMWQLDTLIASHAWSDQSEVAVRYLESPNPCIVEGCAAVRALRKWLQRHPTGRPCERVVRMTVPRTPHTPGQAKLAKGEATIWAEIEADLVSRGVDVSHIDATV